MDAIGMHLWDALCAHSAAQPHKKFVHRSMYNKLCVGRQSIYTAACTYTHEIP
jgi:hypothetical protein